MPHLMLPAERRISGFEPDDMKILRHKTGAGYCGRTDSRKVSRCWKLYLVLRNTYILFLLFWVTGLLVSGAFW